MASKAAALAGQALDALIVRKEPGSRHRRLAGGPLPEPGSRITVLEDVTTGGSSLKAVKQLREAGYVVERVVTIVDRQEGGLAAMQEAGLERSLFQLDEVAAAHQQAQPAAGAPPSA